MKQDEPKKRKRKGERKDGRIQVTAQVGFNIETGKPIRKSFYGKTRAEAEAKRNEYFKMVTLGLNTDSSTMTAAEWIDKWVEMYDVNLNLYNPFIKKMKSDFGSARMLSITEGTLNQSMISYKGASWSNATKYRMILKQCFSKAQKNHIINDNPADDLKLPDTTKGTHRSLERWEVKLIMDNWRTHPVGRWAMLMLLCGLRRGEMAGLDWKDVDLRSRTLRVCQVISLKGSKTELKLHPKTDAGIRVLPICDALMDVFLEVPENERHGFVCKTINGHDIKHGALSWCWESWLRSMNKFSDRPFKIRAHDLRHTFATMLYDAGVDVKAAQYYLGHADLSMTMNIYTHLTNERKESSKEDLTKYLDTYLKQP